LDLFPLFNSLRVALIATVLTFFLGLLAANWVKKTPRILRGVLDAVLTLPLVLPPTVLGFFLLKIFGPHGPVGSLVASLFDAKLVMVWYAAVFASTAVAFPLMYRTVRGALQGFDPDLKDTARISGFSDTAIFWRVTLPSCKQGIIAGTILAFARALGEFGATSMLAGYIPGKTATIATTVYQLWRTGDDRGAYIWVGINLAISCAALLALNFIEGREKEGRGKVSG